MILYDALQNKPTPSDYDLRFSEILRWLERSVSVLNFTDQDGNRTYGFQKFVNDNFDGLFKTISKDGELKFLEGEERYDLTPVVSNQGKFESLIYYSSELDLVERRADFSETRRQRMQNYRDLR